jgi:phasin family protein
MSHPPKTLADFGDFAKLFADMKLPAVPDMEAFVAASRRNIETLTAANRVALEGAQAVARRHMEIVQQSMAEMTEAVRALSTVESPQAKAAKQAELLKNAYEHAVSNLKEIGDLIQNSNAEAVKLLNNRFTEAMDEVKALAQKTTKA